MAVRKKGQLNQVLAPLVDATDFASIESAIVASNIVRRFFGVNHGTSAASTSGAISKVPSTVRSGLFRITLKSTECAYDEMMVRLSATGAALQLIPLDFADADDSDLASQLTVIQSLVSDAHSAAAQANSRVLLVLSNVSDVQSALAVVQSMASDAASAAQQTNSRVLVNQSFLSDIRSHVSDLQSDFQSRVPKAVATNSQLSDLHSDLRSFLVVMSGIQSDLYSQVSDFRSDLLSLLGTTGVQLNASSLSDLRSAIAGVTATVSASDMSDIASRVDVLLASRLSDILSAAQQVNSRVLLVQSQTSDVYSLLSDTNSDLASKIGAMTASVSASDMSDIASRVDVLLASRLSDILSAAQQTNSRVLVIQSQASDLASKLSDVESNLLSVLGTTGVQLNASSLSDIRSAVAGVTASVSASDMSDIASRVGVLLASDLSDILSAAQQANSRVLVVQSMVSDVRAHVSDLQSDFQSRVPKLVATNSQLSDLASDIKSSIGNVSVALTASDISDIASAVAAAVTTITASDISDIASAVRAAIVSDLSDILSAAQQVNSRVLVNQSRISDIYSLLSDVQSDFQSRVPKRVATDSQLSALTSDIISALAAGVPVSASDMSDLRSAIAAGTLTASAISDIASAVALQLASDLSDTLSGVRQANSRLLVAQSQTSDIYSLLSDLHSDVGVLSGVVSDIDSAIDAGVEVGASSFSDLRSMVLANGVLKPGAEPTGVPGHTATMAEKTDWLHALARNKVKTTSTLQSLRDDADANTIASATVADSGGSFVRGEWSS